MRKKIWFTFGMLAVLFGGLAVHLYMLSQNSTVRTAVFQNSRTVTVGSTRGTIYDRNGIPLVNGDWEYRVALIPEQSLLAQVKEMVPAGEFDSLRDRLASGSPASVRLLGPVGLRDGLSLFRVPVRYGERLLAPHLIGYLDHAGQHGVSGLEAAYDDLLNDYSGTACATFAVDGTGHCLTGISPQITNTLRQSDGGLLLTLDAEIQALVEEKSPNYLKKGAVVVMDPYTGGIIAIASFPSFQPDRVQESIQRDDGALLNRALALYDCGSVFKIVTAAAALENGLGIDRVYSCAGSYAVEDVIFHCHNRLGHQNLTMKNAFAQSCNLYFIQLAREIGANALFATAGNFGFCRAITLADGLSTPPAALPERSTLLYSDAALANLSFGQGYLLASPLHIAQMVATVVNDGVMPVPYVVAGTVSETGETQDVPAQTGSRIITSQTASVIRTMMEEVVLSGTGKRAASEVCAVAGKTGTAETGQVSRDGEKPVVQSWFAGYFPAEDPRYVLTILGEDADNTGADTSALFKELAEAIKKNDKKR